ncbi:Putative mannose-6-phosphate isomerase YvyI [Phycisphaerae bacterium RAS2]|nr:Putative mannose-6-phosphate isomerase YvyI [Phycisphaerae bacterium RAS2]
MDVCPLVFEPIYRPKVWGGRNLTRLLNKPLPPPNDQPIGESWEVVDLPDAQSIVARGPVKGRTLHSLVDEWRADLLGRAPLAAGRFPLLIKFLDACQPLSIQVHPDDETAARAGLAPIGKHEAWYVIEARDDAVIYRGLRPDASRERVAEQLARDPASIVDCVLTRRARAGDAFYLPAGTVHAAGGGLVLAEVQTPCDVTYRLYDWDRTRPAGDAGMHLREGVDAIVADPEFATAEKRTHVTSIFTTVTRLVSCPKFRMEKVRFVEGIEQEIPYAELVCWIVLDGRGEIAYGATTEQFAAGDVVVLPAALRKARLKTHTACTWLEVTVPVESDLAEFDRPAAAALRDAPAGNRFVNLGVARAPAEKPNHAG